MWNRSVRGDGRVHLRGKQSRCLHCVGNAASQSRIIHSLVERLFKSLRSIKIKIK